MNNSFDIFINNSVNFFLKKITQKETEKINITIKDGELWFVLVYEKGKFRILSWIDRNVYNKLIKNIKIFQDSSSTNYVVEV